MFNAKAKLSSLMLGCLLVLPLGASAAGDAEKGKQKAMGCVACHGAAGISPAPLWPNLAGQKSAYLEKQLRAFRSGERVDPMMTPMAKPLSDDDIKNIAEYYSQLK